MQNQSSKLAEIQTLYTESFEFLNKRKERWSNQLKLFNNLRRGDENIASTLLITLFNRVLSSVYDDKLQIKFLPSQGILQEQLNTYNVLAQSDYIEMDKKKLDYDWVWDTLAFGRGYVETLQFDQKKKIMKPTTINPLAFGYDPYFPEVQQWRYYWKWISKNKWELNKMIKDGVITGIKDTREIPSGLEQYLWQYKFVRDQARDAVEPAITDSFNQVYQILEFYCYDDDGDKAVYWVDKGFSKILMHKKLDLKDAEDGGSDWPIVIKESFREPHSSIIFSVLDLIEDKHRAKSVLLNLAFVAAKDTANPTYWYDPQKVVDVSAFFSRQINQHIATKGQGDLAVGPINKASPMSAELINFISVLTTEANDPIGTGLTGQPAQDRGSDTATEAAITQQMNDMAQSLIGKVLQFGEEEFWSHWFKRYARYGTGKKIANIVGVKGITSHEVDMGDFNVDYPPGVFIYSAKQAEYKELVERRDLMQLYPQLAQTIGPDGLRNFNKHVFFPKFLQDPSLIDILFPDTLDELKANEENEQLKKDVLPEISESDNHETHIYMHYMVQPKTWATWVHIEEHRSALAKQKSQEQTMQMQQMGGEQTMQAPQVGAQKSSPMESATPLKSEMAVNNGQI